MNKSIERLIERADRASAVSTELLVASATLLSERNALLDINVKIVADIAKTGRQFCSLVGELQRARP